MIRPNQLNEKLLTAAAALCVAAGLATAQQVKVIEKVVDAGDTDCEVECEIVCEGGAEDVVIERVVLGEGAPMRGVRIIPASQPEAKVESHITMVQKTDDREVKVEIKGDDVKAWVDGKSVPSKQIKVTDKEIRILDKDGETITKFGRAAGMVFSGDVGGDADVRRLMARVAPGGRAGEGGIVWESDDGEVFEFEGDNEFFFQPDITRAGPSAPPVMVGINMGSLDADDDELYDLLDEHDLAEEDVIQVIGVIDGLPADKAGLREGDVIVRLDGDWGANPEKLRDVLMEKKAGDNLEFGVIRRGRFREIDVKLSAYNAEKLGAPGITYFEADEETPFALQWRGDNEAHNKMIEELTRKLAAQPKIDAEELRVQIEALAKGLHGENRFPEGMELRLDTLPRMRGLSPRDGGDQRFFIEPGTRVQGGFVDKAQEERLEKIETRLERLENRINRLIEALESRERDRD
ncbi:MAG: PDZ domain-containing protein [Phycisphaerales bacterium JB041]